MTPGLHRPTPSVSRTMTTVMLALIPGTVAATMLISPAVLINVLLCVLVSLILEAIAVACRARPVRATLADGSVTLAAWLFALSLPPLIPLWQILVGCVAMVWLAKHIYGGLGQNPFNPAMVGYATLLVSFPHTMTFWLSADARELVSLAELWRIKFSVGPLSGGELSGSLRHALASSSPSALTGSGGAVSSAWDGMTMATPLDRLRQLDHTNNASAGVVASVRTTLDGFPWHVINAAFLVGGLYLLWRGIIRWHIPASMLLALGILHGLDTLLSDSPGLPPHLALFSGAAMLGAFFIATDPVSAATSVRGRLLYGAGIGVLTFVLRRYSAYPEGVAFAVLLMNLTVPAIDYWIRPDVPRQRAPDS